MEEPIPTWKEYENSLGRPATLGEYLRYLNTNFKDKLNDEADNL